MSKESSAQFKALEKRLAKLEKGLAKLKAAEKSRKEKRWWRFWRKRPVPANPPERPAVESPAPLVAAPTGPVFNTSEELFREAVSFLAHKDGKTAVQLLEDRRNSVANQSELEAVLASIHLHWGNTDRARESLQRAVESCEKQRRKLIWGPIAIISNKYWSAAMRAAGWESETIVYSHASINQKEDFDRYILDFKPEWWPDELPAEDFYSFLQVHAFMYWITHGKVVHIPVTGGFLGATVIWEMEAPLLKAAGIKTVVIPFGGDAYTYSRLHDPTLRYALLANYPELAFQEREIQRRLTYWQENADCFFCGCMLDAMGRWDVTLCSALHIDTSQWKPKQTYSEADGTDGIVKVLHTPNHRGFKGTEFLVAAVDRLKAKGLKIELVLLEKVPNERVRELMQEIDILAEQFVATAYALSGIEGMASGLAVMANLDSEYYTRIYRRYAYLNECPILSTTPETIERNLETLVTRPSLRRELGIAGRKYVEKYHSLTAAQYLFGKIYTKIVDGANIDLFTLFHPVTSELARTTARIEHPLIENRLREDSNH